MTQVHFLKKGGEAKARAEDRPRAAVAEPAALSAVLTGPRERRGRTAPARWSAARGGPPLSAVLTPPGALGSAGW